MLLARAESIPPFRRSRYCRKLCCVLRLRLRHSIYTSMAITASPMARRRSTGIAASTNRARHSIYSVTFVLRIRLIFLFTAQASLQAYAAKMIYRSIVIHY